MGALTIAQRRLLLHHRMYPSDAALNVAVLFEIRGPVDAARLARVAEQVLSSSSALNTVFRGDHGLRMSGPTRVLTHPAEALGIEPDARADEEQASVAAWAERAPTGRCRRRAGRSTR